MHKWRRLGIEQKLASQCECIACATGYKIRAKLFFPAAGRGPTVRAMEQISVTTPVTQAIERVRQVLFNPFDLGKWFVIGFCAWLAGLGEQRGGGSGGHFNTNSNHGSDIHQQFEHARSYVLENLAWIVPLTLFIVVLVLVLVIFFTWLNSRGKFMFLYCVALNRAEIAEPWNRFEAQANSLFWFRLALWAISLVFTLPLVVFMIIIALSMFRNDGWNFAGILLLGALFMASCVIGFFFFLIRKFTIDFVVPIMYLRGNRCLEAWREFRRLLRSNLGNFVLYLLFQLVIALVTTVMVLVIMVVCCPVCCFLMIPYVGTVLLLPIIMFKRAYSLHYLAQYGPSYNVFPSSPAAP